MAANANGIFHQLERKAELSNATPERHLSLRRAAEQLSRRNVDQAVTELLNEAHSRLITLCYERDDTGQLVNVDGATGKVLIPLPWGKKGYAKWGLSPSEADTLRRIMFARQRTGLPLFHFDRSRRSWFLNLASYAALPVVAEWEIGVIEYRAARSG
jgi:hypothetical protein